MIRAAAALALVATLAGCGTVARTDSVEQQIRSQLAADGASCPADLPGEVGRSVVCHATAGGTAFDVKVTVTSVQGDTINFDIERVGALPPPTSVAPTSAAPTSTAPTPEPAAPTVAGPNVARSVREQLTDAGRQVEKVTCPPLPARVRATQRCTLVSHALTYGVTVTVTSVRGGHVEFAIRVDRAPQ